MRKFRDASWCALSALVFCASYLACSSDSKPAGLDTGGASSTGGSFSSSGGRAGSTAVAGSSGKSSSEAGDSSSSAGADTGGGAAGAPVFESDAGPGRPDPGNPVCSETANWSGAGMLKNVTIETDSPAISLTPDELDLAYVQGATLYTSHRATVSDDFIIGMGVIAPNGWGLNQGFALSSDGKRLVLFNNARTALGELTRSRRDATFGGDIDQSAFAVVNQAGTYSGNIFSSPVLSADDEQLFMSSLGPSGGTTVVVATRAKPGDVWSSPTRLGSELDGSNNARRLPTGLSADARTLFYFNEATMKEEARWREEPNLGSPLYDMVDLSTRRGAVPNTACNRLYSVSGSGIAVESD